MMKMKEKVETTIQRKARPVALEDILTKNEIKVYREIEEAIKENKRIQYALLGRGISRSVYALSDRYVLKVERGQDSCNLAEFIVYSKHKKTMSDSLAEVVFISKDFKLLIMERLEVTVARCHGVGDILKRYCDLKFDVSRKTGITDIHDSNVMVAQDGKIMKVIDYGFNERLV